MQPLWRTVWRFLKKLKVELSYDPAIPPGIYPEKTISWKDTCTPMFSAALLKIAKTWKQPKCPSMEEWIKKMWCIYTKEYYSNIKKEWNNAICRNMGIETIILSEFNQTVNDKHHMISPICGILKKKKGYKWTIFRTETDSQTEKLMVTKGDRCGG